ncbi:phage recombination protein Bet [Rhodococcus erythropolis]|uniref:phage recombination protein Bet n=1 Tax=Rhodococcus erythropolis TaxID=1833 RepID=UPI00406BAA9A
MTEIAVHSNDTLAISSEQTEFTGKQVAALKQIGVDKATEGDLMVFFHQCQRTGLDPFARQIYMIGRNSKEWDPQTRKESWTTKYTIQTGIDGFRLIARRAVNNARGTFGYEDTLWCGEDGQWTDVWLRSGPPSAAKVTVVRDGSRYPAVALMSEYVGTDKNGNATKMWREKGALMLAKCAEALALRKAFPQDLSGLYTSDEMQQANVITEDGAPASRQQPSRQRSIAETLGESVTVDVESLVKAIEKAETKDALRELWTQTATLPAQEKDDIQALIMGRIQGMSEPESDGASLPEPEQLPLDAEPVDAETVEEQVAS